MSISFLPCCSCKDMQFCAFVMMAFRLLVGWGVFHQPNVGGSKSRIVYFLSYLCFTASLVLYETSR